MSITFYCPNQGCRAKMTVPDSVVGKRGKCTKCKEVMVVPAVSDDEPPAPKSAAKAPPRGPRPLVPPKPEAPPPPPVDQVDEAAAAAAAADVFADAPTEAEKAAEFIEFTCPQCDEPIRMPLDMGGKRAPCPECRRIIPVPVPKRTEKTSWRDTGPNLPLGAKREEQAAPEGAWEGKAGAVGTEALKEAGVIQDKRKPLTALQKAWPYLLLGTPVVVLLVGGLFLWQYLNAASEKKSLAAALSSAQSEAGQNALGSDGLIALHGYAGRYYLRTGLAATAKKPGAATLAKEQYVKVVSVAGAWHTEAADALLGEIALAQLDLAGTAAEVSADQKSKWADVQKLVRSTLATIRSQPGKVAALRKVAEGMVGQGQTKGVLALTLALYPNDGAERSEALAVVGLELLRLGKKEEAAEACAKAEAPYKDQKTRPALRAAVVALAVALERKPPEVADKESLEDSQQRDIGTAEGLARLGKLPEARQEAEKIATGGGGRLRARVALADGAYSTKQGDAADLNAALDSVGEGAKRPELSWVYLRLVELALAANVPEVKIDPAIAAIADRHLADWARLLVYRKRLEASKAVEPDASLGSLTSERLGGLVARLEMARHNTRRDGGWAKAVNGWDDGSKALGSLGVALGMQGGK